MAMARTPEQAAQAMIDNLHKNTGKTLKQWFTVLQKTRFDKHGEYLKFLKTEHDVTHGYANLIAHQYRDSLAGKSKTATDPVAQQYAGAKEALRPIYDKLAKMVQGFGNDVELSPKKAYVSLRRKKQFALIQPSTKDRVDLGINLKGEKPGKRLEASGSFNAMVSHRIRLATAGDVDAEVKNWLMKAYNAAG
tara:strand:- start:891 stop:1466 length:576 start_codon:yes stop_codon:yes gene_type:complete